MSASSDRPPPFRPGLRTAPPAPGYEFDDAVTGPPPADMLTHDPHRHAGAPVPDIQPPLRAEPYETAPEGEAGSRKQTHAPIVPAGTVTGSSLTLVISIMCFLACLTAGAVYMMKRSADAWLRDIASEVTVQVEPRAGADAGKTAEQVVTLLQEEPGFIAVTLLTEEETGKLLEPWLGTSDAWKALQVPRLIALELDRGEPADLEKIRAKLTARFKGVSLDDHRQWQAQIRTVTRSFALGGLAILLLVGAATTAIIVSATKSAMASNREIVEVLHFVGATDRFIAREFEKHFLRLGIRAGLVGAISAMLVFLLMPWVVPLLGGGAVTLAEMHRLIGSGTLDAAGHVLLIIVVVVIAALCMLTSRFGVFSILNNRS